MGWERKRGALTELNRYLRGAGDTSLSTVMGDATFLPRVTFVVTLDADTVLPRDAARKLVCTIAHPLNRARVDRGPGHRPSRPRARAAAREHDPGVRHGHRRSPRSNTGPAGIDHTPAPSPTPTWTCSARARSPGRASSRSTSFNAVLEGRFPDETLLSHDLMEGNFLRTGARERHRGAPTSSRPTTAPSAPACTAGRAATGRPRGGCAATRRWPEAGPPATRCARCTAGNCSRTCGAAVLPASIIVLGAAGWLLIPRAEDAVGGGARTAHRLPGAHARVRHPDRQAGAPV